MIDGYAGSILRVDLSSGEVSKTPLPGELVDNYIGGRGFVAKLLNDELPPNTDPLSPENMFLAATGPLSGYFLPARAPFRATFCRPAAKPISAPNRRPPAGMRTAIWAAISARI
jgi:aldehyde:ferredoxin oxidoreductase